MRKAYVSSVLVVALAAAACESDTQFLDIKQGMAVDTALNRGRLELNCSAVTPTVLSREVVEPAIMGPRVYGIDRAEYTIGVSGCGDRRLSSSVPMAATAASPPAPAGSTVSHRTRSTCA